MAREADLAEIHSEEGYASPERIRGLAEGKRKEGERFTYCPNPT
jgi:hypothetical protein